MRHSLARGAVVTASTRKLTMSERRSILTRMRSVVGVALLLIQLSPAMGAVMCMQMASSGAARCSMPMPAKSPEGDRSNPGHAQDCAVMAVCAPTTLAAPSPVVALLMIPQPEPPSYPAPASLFPSDPVVPPKPPPIA